MPSVASETSKENHIAPIDSFWPTRQQIHFKLHQSHCINRFVQTYLAADPPVICPSMVGNRTKLTNSKSRRFESIDSQANSLSSPVTRDSVSECGNWGTKVQDQARKYESSEINRSGRLLLWVEMITILQSILVAMRRDRYDVAKHSCRHEER